MVLKVTLALNLKDSGVNVIVGLYPGSKSAGKAEAAGLAVHTVADAGQQTLYDSSSDEAQKTVYKQEIEPHLTEGRCCLCPRL